MKFLIAAISIFTAFLVEAHPGQTNKEGCHVDEKTGEQHCHKAPETPNRKVASKTKMNKPTVQNVEKSDAGIVPENKDK